MSESHNFAGSMRPHPHWLLRARLAAEQEDNDD